MTSISRVDTRNPLLIGVLRLALSVTALIGLLTVGALLGVSTIAGAPDLASAATSASVQFPAADATP